MFTFALDGLKGLKRVHGATMVAGRQDVPRRAALHRRLTGALQTFFMEGFEDTAATCESGKASG